MWEGHGRRRRQGTPMSLSSSVLFCHPGITAWSLKSSVYSLRQCGLRQAAHSSIMVCGSFLWIAPWAQPRLLQRQLWAVCSSGQR